jgi:hypothetical protein
MEQRRDMTAFWAELSACDHFVQVYDTDEAFLATLADFVTSGMRRGNAAVVIATEAHRQGLADRLAATGTDLAARIGNGQYFALDAEQTLARFMVNGWPDDDLFQSVIRGILRQARGTKGRQIVAFGEMVALLWSRGDADATMRLEFLWKEICQKKQFQLFCAYPRTGFSEEAASIARLCGLHSKVVPT